MDKTPFDDEINNLETRIGVAGTELGILKKKRAEYFCPYKVGQILVNKKGQRVEITAILSGWSFPDYKLKGQHILKSGERSQITRTLYDWDDWKPDNL